MRELVSIADIDALQGSDWAPQEKKPRAVLLANAWLNAAGLPDLDSVPSAWRQAGAELALEASLGNLFSEEEIGLTGRSIEADGVAVSKTYSEGARRRTAGESIALALLEPWLKKRSSVFVLRRA